MWRGGRRGAGFTIIELMGVVTIMFTIVILAMPYIRQYNARVKVSEALLMMGQCRNQVYEVYASGSDLPAADTWGCEAEKPAPFVERIQTSSEGVIKIQLGNRVGDLRLAFFSVTLAPLNGSGQPMTDVDLGTPIRRWRCGSTTDGTDPELRNYLPSTCRG